MNKGKYEVEQKYRIADPAAFRRLLKKEGARKLKASEEFNELFDRRSELAKQGRVLRLRHHGGREGVLTYKGPREKGRHKKRVEIEAGVDWKVMKVILSELGYTSAASYDKYREEYRLGSATVTLDRMKGLGWFAEIEAPSRIILRVEKQLGLGPSDREERSYLEMQFAMQGKKYPWKRRS